MKCKKCGHKLDSGDMRRDGTIKCRACGAVNRVPGAEPDEAWEIEESGKRGFLSSLPWETKIFGLPFRLWCLIGFGLFLVLIVAAIAIGIHSSSGMDPTQGQGEVTIITTPAPTEVPDDAPVIQVTQAPTDATAEPAQVAATVVPGAKSTGVSVGEFLQRFQYAMNYYLQTSTFNATDAGADEGGNGRLMVDDTLSISYKINSAGEITTLTLDGRGDGSTESGYRQMYAIASAIYGFDASFVATNGFNASSSILRGSTYTASNFTASGKMVNGTGMTVMFAGNQ